MCEKGYKEMEIESENNEKKENSRGVGVYWGLILQGILERGAKSQARHKGRNDHFRLPSKGREREERG